MPSPLKSVQALPHPKPHPSKSAVRSRSRGFVVTATVKRWVAAHGGSAMAQFFMATQIFPGAGQLTSHAIRVCGLLVWLLYEFQSANVVPGGSGAQTRAQVAWPKNSPHGG